MTSDFTDVLIGSVELDASVPAESSPGESWTRRHGGSIFCRPYLYISTNSVHRSYCLSKQQGL